jgi:aminoglycoside phosphotransferase (APT) family kinase protein
VSRSALRLAALANAVVPGLAPASAQGVAGEHGDLYEFAFVTDTQDRSWVVKAGKTEVAGALLEDAIALTVLLARRLDILVPVVRAVAVLPRGRAVVYPRLPGGAVDFAALPPGPGLAAEVGRALAHVHNIELAVFDEAGRPSYDAEAHRKRTLSELDRASASGHVPAGLLSRWERQLEDVSLWRFAPTPVHGHFVGSSVLAEPDPEDPSRERVLGILGWEDARIGDPADDFAQLLVEGPDEAVDTVLEAYVQSRIERPDANLLARARLAAQMSHVHQLLRALAAEDGAHVERISARLRELDEQLRTQDEHRAEDERRRLAERQAERDRQRLATTHRAPTDSAADATQPFATPAVGDPGQAFPEGPSADLATQPMSAFTGKVTPDGSLQSSPDIEPGSLGQHRRPEVPATAASPASSANRETPETEDAPPLAPEVVDDLHEGASEFVRVEPRARHTPPPGPSG